MVRHRGRVIVCETGIGTELPEKRARRVGLWEPELATHRRTGMLTIAKLTTPFRIDRGALAGLDPG